MSQGLCLRLHNGEASPCGAIPQLPIEAFREHVLASVEAGARIVAFFGMPGLLT